MRGHGREPLEPQVRQGAHGQRNFFAHEAGHQLGVIERVIAVIHTRNFQNIERVGDVLGGAFLAGMGDGDESFLACGLVHPGEVFGRVADLTGIQSDSVDMFLVAAGRMERLEGLFLGEVAQEAHDQP